MAERDGCGWCCVGSNLLVSSLTRLLKVQEKDEVTHEWNVNGPTYLGLNCFWFPLEVICQGSGGTRVPEVRKVESLKVAGCIFLFDIFNSQTCMNLFGRKKNIGKKEKGKD